MKIKHTLIPVISVLFLFFTVACSSQPDIDVNEISAEVKEFFRESEMVSSSAFDGKKEIKFRLMVDEPMSEEEANNLFALIVNSFETYSAHTDFWDYYNGYFDLKSYSSDVIYEATKLVGEDLQLVSK